MKITKVEVPTYTLELDQDEINTLNLALYVAIDADGPGYLTPDSVKQFQALSRALKDHWVG